MKHYFLLLVIYLPILGVGQKKIVVDEKYNYPDGSLPENWWSEGCEAVIKDGHLFVDADDKSYGMASVWLDRRIAGDFIIEYDASIVASKGDKNNINCFLLYSTPDNTLLRDTRNERKDGLYSHYHELNGFIFTFLPNDGNVNEARFRFRKNPGFELVQERVGYRCISGEIYHIKIKKKGNRFRYWVDGKKFIDKNFDELDADYNQGLFGFRTWSTAIWWDNLLIKQL